MGRVRHAGYLFKKEKDFYKVRMKSYFKWLNVVVIKSKDILLGSVVKTSNLCLGLLQSYQYCWFLPLAVQASRGDCRKMPFPRLQATQTVMRF